MKGRGRKLIQTVRLSMLEIEANFLFERGTKRESSEVRDVLLYAPMYNEPSFAPICRSSSQTYEQLLLRT
jgi:hypothetical protein